MFRRAARTATAEASTVECTHCGLAMTSSACADGGAYYSCPRCARTYASSYGEVFRKAAGARTTAPKQEAGDPRFDEVKRRLEAWLRRLDEQDPWFVLGVAPGAGLEAARTRYRELALQHHPDRGGNPEEMQRITRAYDEIRTRVASGRAPTGAPKRIAAPLLDD